MSSTVTPRDLPTLHRLSDATTALCRWIVRRERFGEYLICGRHARPGSSYCPDHHVVVWRPTMGQRFGRM